MTVIEMYPVLTDAQRRSRPAPEWSIEHVIPSQGIGMVYGASYTGKTFVALDLALHERLTHRHDLVAEVHEARRPLLHHFARGLLRVERDRREIEQDVGALLPRRDWTAATG